MDPRLLLFFIFIGFPLLEIYVLLEVGERLGSEATIFVIVFTGVMGVLLLRHQGMYTVSRMRKSMERGEIPAMAMFEGVFIFASAILLLVPGFITDVVGFAFLITPIRRFIIYRIMHSARFIPPGGGVPPTSSEQSGPNVIEGECRREDDEDKGR